MAKAEIPDEIRHFILNHVDSIAYIEALVLLRRDATVAWNRAELATRLYISAGEAHRILNRLHAHGLVAEDNGLYRFSCNSEDLRGIVDRLLQIYATHLIPVTNLIHSRTSQRMQQFADAFRLNKGK